MASRECNVLYCIVLLVRRVIEQNSIYSCLLISKERVERWIEQLLVFSQIFFKSQLLPLLWSSASSNVFRRQSDCGVRTRFVSTFYLQYQGKNIAKTDMIGRGIYQDLKDRLPWYQHDWKEGFNSGIRILAPATYIFFASAIPALAFGEQLSEDTEGTLNGVHVLTATALCGIIQAIFGGQPLLIVGVAEPIVLVYMFMYEFAKEQEIKFLPWATWVCIWTSLFIFILAGINSCKFIDKFTRFSGEVFGMLIAVLFMQQAVKGTVKQFQSSDEHDYEYSWRLANGLWGVVLALGLLYTSLQLHEARKWRFFKGFIRSLVADYGVPLMVIVWTGVSYAIDGWPKGLPNRLQIPNTWDERDTWKVIRDLADVEGSYIAAAMIPAIIITLLFYFDHNVSSQLAQQKEFNLVKPSTYNWDFFLLGIMTLICGLIGVPPVNGVLPQAPMHTKSLATLKKMLRKAAIRKSASKAQLKHKEESQKAVEPAKKQAVSEGQEPQGQKPFFVHPKEYRSLN
eukprot:TRINITY_DN240_c1_g1_i6.p1 TRINITY_DN240_c1_g1~~TRINITY_DN240_c1_g1_i6.p1  ORF type:complete len:511 (-),score=42.37 TRINITY_DN240_c1_g1_i6:800-2332(-)